MVASWAASVPFWSRGRAMGPYVTPTLRYHPDMLSHETSASAPVREERKTISLPDGRTLAWTAFGAGEGPANLVLDGPGSRGMPRAASPIARARHPARRTGSARL